MTNSTFIGPARTIAPLAALLLFAGCDRQAAVRQTQAPTISNDLTADESDAPEELLACDPPELEPIARPTLPAAMLPVAYPGDELAASAQSDRPFSPIDPELPLPPGLQSCPAALPVEPFPDTATAAPQVPVIDAPRMETPTQTATVPGNSTGSSVETGGTPSGHVRAGETPAAHVGAGGTPAPQGFAAGEAPAPQYEQLARRPRRDFRPASTASRPRAVRAYPPVEAPSAPLKPATMQAVTQQAEQMIRRGYHLAERGALYSGRAEFIQALSTIAQALDLQSGGRNHTEALAAGLTALEEAEDFIPSGPELESDLDLPTLLRAHRTPVCKQIDTNNLLPVTVLQQYYRYAQEQLALAADGQEAASMALLGLGKTYGTLAVEKALPTALAEPKAMVFHWAALSAHAGNFLAANELAVLEARWGQLATARSLLRYSLTILPHSAVWRNLALVHQRLGETKLAELAMREADVAAKREADAKPGNPQGIVPSSDVKWLDAKTFASTSRSEIDPQKPMAANDSRAEAPTKPAVEPAPPRHRSAAAWFPWLR